MPDLIFFDCFSKLAFWPGRASKARLALSTLALEAKAKEAAKKIETALGGKAFDGDSHALLMAVYKNVDYPMELRMDAAKAAIRFEKPALSSVDGKGNIVPAYIAYLPQPCATPAEWLDQFGHLRTTDLAQKN
jgi:hypothetical protein